MLSDGEKRRRAVQWTTLALILAALFSVGYSTFRIVSGYRDHRDALSVFGRTVREQAAARHWRFEAVRSMEEGLPLYLTRPHFLHPDRAVTEWNAGRIDALVVPEDEVPRFMNELQDVAPPSLQSVQRRNLPRPNYVLLTRSR